MVMLFPAAIKTSPVVVVDAPVGSTFVPPPVDPGLGMVPGVVPPGVVPPPVPPTVDPLLAPVPGAAPPGEVPVPPVPDPLVPPDPAPPPSADDPPIGFFLAKILAPRLVKLFPAVIAIDPPSSEADSEIVLLMLLP